MIKLLLGKIEEIKENLQQATVERINLGMTIAYYEKINASKKEYNSNKSSIKKTFRTLFKVTIQFISVGVFVNVILETLPLFLKFCLGGFTCIEVLTLSIMISELKKIYDEKKFLIKNGYDPEDEYQMNKLDEKLKGLYDDYKICDAYIDDLIEEEEELKSFISSNNMVAGLEKYSEMLKEYLNSEFNEYLNDQKTLDPKNVDFEPNVLEEDLAWSNPHQLRLK